jgi:GH24 family phage-related lysozyme (muramidase)
MRLRQLFAEQEPTTQGAANSGNLSTGSDWASSVFGDVNQAINKPWELEQPGDDANTTGTTTTRGTTTGAADSPGSAGAAGVSADSDLITMIKGFEGYHEKTNPSAGARSPVRPYWDVAQWSIGYGSYAGSRDRNRRPNITWTPQQAEQALRSQLVPYRRNVESINRRGGYNWSPAQLDALTSFAYNLGSINELTANGTRSNRQIADKMLEYVNAGGRPVQGLVNRRRIERQKFLQGMGQGRLDYAPARVRGR